MKPGSFVIKAVCLSFLCLLPLISAAQTRQETSLYQKTLKKPGVKSAEKFIKKYPSSLYIPKVVRLRDSLLFYALDPEDAAGVQAFRKDYPDSYFAPAADERIRLHNTSSISAEQAFTLAGDCLGAAGWKKDNVEHILALDNGLSLRFLSPDGSLEQVREIPVYSLQEQPGQLTIVLPPEVSSPLGWRNYLHFAYLNGDSEYVEVLYMPEEDIVHQAMFYGKPLAGSPYRIEGQSPEAMEGLRNTAEVNWLCARIAENPSLVPVAKADLLTDNAVKWWLERNPNAMSTASRLNIGVLDKESSIVAAYGKARKEKGKGYNAALFDIRGYTVVCAYSRSTGEYSLVWCEPVCKNTRRDRFLNSVYFESDGTTLVFFYYKGSNTFKYRVSLASKTLRR